MHGLHRSAIAARGSFHLSRFIWHLRHQLLHTPPEFRPHIFFPLFLDQPTPKDLDFETRLAFTDQANRRTLALRMSECGDHWETLKVPAIFSTTDPHATHRRRFGVALTQSSLGDRESLLKRDAQLAVSQIKQHAHQGLVNIL